LTLPLIYVILKQTKQKGEIMNIILKEENEKTELTVINQQDLMGKDFAMYGTFEDPLFLAKDVAVWIEHNKVSLMLKSVAEYEKLTYAIHMAGQNRDMWFLTEDGLYEVIMLSRKPVAKEFKKGVKQLLKAVRKQNTLDNQPILIQQESYLIQDPIERARAWIVEQE
jgi:anti-repressor protein